MNQYGIYHYIIYQHFHHINAHAVTVYSQNRPKKTDGSAALSSVFGIQNEIWRTHSSVESSFLPGSVRWIWRCFFKNCVGEQP